AERLVLRMSTAAEGVVLPRGTPVADHVLAVAVNERGPTDDAIGAVPGDLDCGLSPAVVVDVAAGLLPVDGVAEGSGGAVAHRPDDLVHPPAARGDERLLAQVEDSCEPVGAEARMLACAPVVQDGHLLTDIGVSPVRDTIGVLGF